MESNAFAGQLRIDLGKKANKKLRNEGQIPCVLYGGNEVVHFYTTLKEVKTLIYTPDFKIAELNLNSGKQYKCIVKDYQLHPLSDELVHIDFLNLVEDQKVKLDIPIRFKGSSPGVKVGGKLVQKLRKVKVKTTPDRIIEEMIVDISSLELGQSLRVRDIIPQEGVEILSSVSIPVTTVEIPRALRSATMAAEKDTKKKK
jgi:large subunit ribosomal protein L25